MPLSTRAQELKDLYDAIIARGKGQKVQSASQKGRNVSYADTSLADMVKLYRLLWNEDLGAEADVPLLDELGTAPGSRGLIRMRPF